MTVLCVPTFTHDCVVCTYLYLWLCYVYLPLPVTLLCVPTFTRDSVMCTYLYP